MEMPDVECLGIIHSLDDDPEDVRRASQPGSTAGSRSASTCRTRPTGTARGHRGTYVTYELALPTGYSTTRDKLHGFWERAGSDPAALARSLPGPRLEAVVRPRARCGQDDELRGRTRGRRRPAKSRQWAVGRFTASSSSRPGKDVQGAGGRPDLAGPGLSQRAPVRRARLWRTPPGTKVRRSARPRQQLADHEGPRVRSRPSIAVDLAEREGAPVTSVLESSVPSTGISSPLKDSTSGQALFATRHSHVGVESARGSEG